MFAGGETRTCAARPHAQRPQEERARRAGGKDDGSWLSRSSNHRDKVWRGAPPARAWEQGTRENQGPSLHPDCVKCSTIKKYFDITCEIKNKLN